MRLPKRGDVRADGFTFIRSYTNRNGTLCEQWLSPMALRRYEVSAIVKRCSERAAKAGVPFDLSRDYLISIYPSDGLCPIFLVPMERGRGRDNSPSVDRIEPSKGYVRGNVCWISFRANILKGNVSLAEMERLVALIKGSLNG